MAEQALWRDEPFFMTLREYLTSIGFSGLFDNVDNALRIIWRKGPVAYVIIFNRFHQSSLSGTFMKQKQGQDVTAKPGMCVPEIMRCRPHTTHCFAADLDDC